MKCIRTAAVLILAGAMLFSLASCKGASKDEVAITFWTQGSADPKVSANLWDVLTEQFKKDTGITVNVTYVDWGQAITKYTLAASGGEAPDVAETFYAYSWVKIGGDKYGPMIIDDVIAEMGEENFYSVAKPECFIDGHWYAAPWRGDTRVAAYNQQVFDEAGIKEFPKTYDELIEIGKKLTTYNADGSVDRAGYLVRVSNGNFAQSWFPVLAGFGGTVMDDSFTEWTFNSPAGRESLKFLYDSIYTYKIMPTTMADPSFDSYQTFMAGKTAILLGADPGFMQSVENNAPQLASYVRSAVLPSKTGSGISSVAFAAPVCVFKTTKHPEAAKAWLKYFCSKDVQLKAMKEMSLVNSRIDVMNDPYFQNDPWFKPITEQTKRATAGDMPIPEWSEICAWPSGPLSAMFTEIMTGGDIQTALNGCMDKVKAITRK